MEIRLKLSSTDRNAVHAMGILVLAFILFVQSSWSGVFLALFIGALYGAIVPEIYQATMNDSIHVLKSSLVISVISSLLYAISKATIYGISSFIFLITPIMYDFVKEIIFNPDQSKTSSISIKILEIFVESILSAIIGIIINYLIKE